MSEGRRLCDALTPRQIELLLWQIVMEMCGGEMGMDSVDDDPAREVLVYLDENGNMDIIANERVDPA